MQGVRVVIVAVKPVKADGAKDGREKRSRKGETMEEEPAEVPETGTQAGEVRARWAWTEPCVWTDRMLEALENGVKGGKWFSLIDKVYSVPNLKASFARVKANDGTGGTDGQSIAMFDANLEREIMTLSEELRDGSYRPRPVRRTYIDKPGSREKRPLGIPTVRDRVVQGAVRNAIEPIFEREFAESSFGFRPGRSCKDALGKAWEGMNDEGLMWVVDADIRSYFDTIPHGWLMRRIEEHVADGRVLGLIRMFLTQGVMDGMRYWEPEEGTPQGGVISPLLANIYLNELDHALEAKGVRMVRYADDFVVLCRSQDEAETVLDGIREWMNANGLMLHPDKTRLVDMTQPGEGFDFLGFRFERTRGKGRLGRWARKKSVDKLKDKIREYTRRNSPKSTEETVRKLKAVLRGWYNYFRASNTRTFHEVDGWVRRRMRSLFRRRTKRKGISKGIDDCLRWNNAYFESIGLFSTERARLTYLQSLKGAL